MANFQDMETYYNKLWRNPSWGTRHPNSDEQARADVILRLIENYVLPFFGTEQSLGILDLGCGRGWFTHILTGYGRVVGIDPVQASVKRAQELFPELDFRVGTAADFLSRWGRVKFQLIVSSEVIEHVVGIEKESFMKLIYSLLVPGGFAILTAPRGELWEALVPTHSTNQPVEQWISEFDLEQLSLSVGFRIVNRDRVFLPRVSYNWTSRVVTSKLFSLLMSYFPQSKVFAKLRYYCGIYQVILLQRKNSFS